MKNISLKQKRHFDMTAISWNLLVSYIRIGSGNSLDYNKCITNKISKRELTLLLHVELFWYYSLNGTALQLQSEISIKSE